MTDQPIFVLAWVTREGESLTAMGEGGEVLFVEHPERGWEIPGGHLETGEKPAHALLREVREETGLECTIVRWNKDYYPKGWVAHVHVSSSSTGDWGVDDEKVSSVKWWGEVPPVKVWTVEEFEDLARYFSS